MIAERQPSCEALVERKLDRRKKCSLVDADSSSSSSSNDNNNNSNNNNLLAGIYIALAPDSGQHLHMISSSRPFSFVQKRRRMKKRSACGAAASCVTGHLALRAA